MEEKIVGVEAMNVYAAAFVRTLERGPKATIVALKGDLGTGKTTFVQSAAKALGITESVTSPTFVIQKTYPLVGQKFARLVHIDAYRLKDAHELEVLGWAEAVSNAESLIFIEWPERVEGALPKGAIEFHLQFIDENTRGVERKDA